MPEPSVWLAGVDAGGTRTRVAVTAADGQRRGPATGGPGNLQELGAERLADLCTELLARLTTETPDVLCAAVAGAGRRDEQAALADVLQARGAARRVCVVSDGRAALEGAHGGGPGLVVIAGTGSIVLGRNAVDRVERAGGWGPLLGDEGSAYGLVVSALRAVLRARDGAGPTTSLDGSLKAFFELSDWDALIRAVYGGHLVRDRLAAAGPVVFAEADGGDEVALALIEEGGTALGRQVAAVASRLGLESPAAVACTGGVFRRLDAMWPALERGARLAGVGIVHRPAQLSALSGALLLAAEQAGIRLPKAAVAAWPAPEAEAG